MFSMIHALSMLAVGAVATFLPFLNTLMVSEISSTSSRKCEMKTMLVPPSPNRRMNAKRRFTSGAERAEVGSSRMMMRAPE